MVAGLASQRPSTPPDPWLDGPALQRSWQVPDSAMAAASAASRELHAVSTLQEIVPDFFAIAAEAASRDSSSPGGPISGPSTSTSDPKVALASPWDLPYDHSIMAAEAYARGAYVGASAMDGASTAGRGVATEDSDPPADRWWPHGSPSSNQDNGRASDGSAGPRSSSPAGGRRSTSPEELQMKYRSLLDNVDAM